TRSSARTPFGKTFSAAAMSMAVMCPVASRLPTHTESSRLAHGRNADRRGWPRTSRHAASARLGGAAAPGMHPRKFRAEKKDLCRVVQPEQQYDERSRCGVSRRDRAVAEIKPDRQPSEIEEHRGRESTGPDVAPGNPDVRQPLVEQGEKKGEGADRNDEIEQENQSDVGERKPPVMRQRRE